MSGKEWGLYWRNTLVAELRKEDASAFTGPNKWRLAFEGPNDHASRPGVSLRFVNGVMALVDSPRDSAVFAAFPMWFGPLQAPQTHVDRSALEARACAAAADNGVRLLKLTGPTGEPEVVYIRAVSISEGDLLVGGPPRGVPGGPSDFTERGEVAIRDFAKAVARAADAFFAEPDDGEAILAYLRATLDVEPADEFAQARDTADRDHEHARGVVLTTTDTVDGFRVVRYFDPVAVTHLASVGAASERARRLDAGASSGNSESVQLDALYRAAFAEIRSLAQAIGANCLLRLHADLGQIALEGSPWFMLNVIATPVIIEPNTTQRRAGQPAASAAPASRYSPPDRYSPPEPPEQGERVAGAGAVIAALLKDPEIADQARDLMRHFGKAMVASFLTTRTSARGLGGLSITAADIPDHF